MLSQHPISCFGEMPRNGDCGATVSFGRKEPLIKQTDMLLAAGFHANSDVGGLDKRPLEIVVDVAAGAAVANMAAAGDDARDQACVAGQVFSARKSLNHANLQPHQRRQNRAQAR